MTTAILQTDSTAAATTEHDAATAARHSAERQTVARTDAAAAADSTARPAVAVDSTVQVTALSDTVYVFGKGYAWRTDGSEDETPALDSHLKLDSLMAACRDGGRYGVAGDPVPYTIRGDNTVTALLLGCFIIALAAFANSRRFMLRQVKHFFREPRTGVTEMTETTAEVRHQLFFVLQTCLLLSIISFLYTLDCVADTFNLSSQYQLVAIFFGVFAGYFALKTLLYWVVNCVFFGKRESVRWLKSLLFATSAEGLALFPLVLLQSYFDLSVQKAIIYTAFVIVLVKMMLLYKSFVMFFKNKSFFLQIILYFCALEIIPLLSLGGVLVKVVDNLKINF